MFFMQENRTIVDGDCLIGTAVECIQGKHYHLKTQTLLTFTSKYVHQKRKCGYSLNCLFSIFTMFDLRKQPRRMPKMVKNQDGHFAVKKVCGF